MTVRPVWQGALCVLIAASVAADAQPELVNERMIFGPRDRVSRGLLQMRVTPGGKYLLYFKWEKVRERRDPDTGELEEIWWSFLTSRNLASGQDRDLSVLGLFASHVMQLDCVHPSGEKVVLPDRFYSDRDEQDEANGARVTVPAWRVDQVYCATGKVEPIGLPLTILDDVLPMYDRKGEGLIVLNNHDFLDAQIMEVMTTPLARIKLRKLSVEGVAFGVCPTDDLVVVPQVLRDAKHRPERGGLLLYDVVADKAVAELPVQQLARPAQTFRFEWTADGRYLYYADTHGNGSPPSNEGRSTPDIFTRVWDRTESKEIASLEGSIPLGPGPTPTTMTLAGASQPKVWDKVLLHDASAGKTWTLGESFADVICARGKYVIYSKEVGVDETAPYSTAVHLAEIAMPEEQTAVPRE